MSSPPTSSAASTKSASSAEKTPATASLPLIPISKTSTSSRSPVRPNPPQARRKTKKGGALKNVLGIFPLRIKVPAERRLHICLLRALVRDELPQRRRRRFRPGRQRQSASQRPVGHLHRLHSALPIRRHRHRRDFRHVHPARLPARHLPALIHQAHFKIRLFRRTLGRLFRRHNAFLFWFGFRNYGWLFRSLGRSHPLNQRPYLVVRSTVPLFRHPADFLSWLAFFLRRCADSQSHRRLPPGRSHLHDLRRGHHHFQRHAQPRTFLERHPRSRWLASARQHHALLDC